MLSSAYVIAHLKTLRCKRKKWGRNFLIFTIFTFLKHCLDEVIPLLTSHNTTCPNVSGAFRVSLTESHRHLCLGRRQWVRSDSSKEVTAWVSRTSRNTRQIPWERKQSLTSRRISWTKRGGERRHSSGTERTHRDTREQKLCSVVLLRS